MKSTIAKRMNKLLSLCLVLFACLALSATAFADPKTAKKYAREATKAYADGKAHACGNPQSGGRCNPVYPVVAGDHDGTGANKAYAADNLRRYTRDID